MIETLILLLLWFSFGSFVGTFGVDADDFFNWSYTKSAYFFGPLFLILTAVIAAVLFLHYDWECYAEERRLKN